MTGSKLSPNDVVICPNRSAPTEKYHPLLHLLRLLIVEAYRKQKAQGCSDASSFLGLFYQLDFLWSHLQGDAIEKYEFLRNRLSLVYLWKNEDLNVDDFTRCLMNPPIHMANVFRENREQVLMALRPGQLFVSDGDTDDALHNEQFHSFDDIL